MQSRPLTAETALLLACCRWPVAIGLVRAAAAAGVDWDRLTALSRRHRVQGLVRHALDAARIALPDRIAEKLAVDAADIRIRSARLAAESYRLIKLLEKSDVPTIVLKGSPLAMLAYGSIAVKMAWDIDLLIPAGRLAQAAEILTGAGYVCTLPGPDPLFLPAWHAFSKESVWRRSRDGTHVELHTALTNHAGVLQEIDVLGPLRPVEISPGIALPTLPDDELFAYLCVHGAVSGWRRAKWLADLAALLAPLPHGEIARLRARSVALGAGRAADVALLLCRDRLGLNLEPSFAAELERSVAVRIMIALADRLLTAPDGYDDPAETAIGTVPIHLMQALLMPGWRFTAAELRRKANPDPRIATRLSRIGRVVYPIVASVRRLRRRPVT